MESTPRLTTPRVIDATLREGAQAAGVRFSEAQTAEIAQALCEAGVDMVECGHPMVGPEERRRVRAAVAACGEAPVLSHARARVEDVSEVADTGARWVGIFIGVNEASRKVRIHDPLSIPSLISTSVTRARELGLKVRFTVEDASRTDWEELAEAYRIAAGCGADRLCFADTVGRLCPWETEDIVARLRQEFPAVELEVHFHDDRGMANANALAAARAGAAWISASVNGIGERCGITDTVLLIANLATLGWREEPQGEVLQHLSALVQSHSRMIADRWRPVVGRNAFTHVAKLHRRAVMLDEASYTWTKPEALGRATNIEPAILEPELDRLINHPQVISATELRHHRAGPGERYVMIDNRVVADARQYCIVRRIPVAEDHGPGHVDTHRHSVDSLFLFLGNEAGLTGLEVEVRLGDRLFPVSSPASVFIPSGLVHSYRVVRGGGLFLNHVLDGDYNSSLLDERPAQGSDGAGAAEAGSAAGVVEIGLAAAAGAGLAGGLSGPGGNAGRPGFDALNEFFRDRLPGLSIGPETPLAETLDSLLFLDLFLHIESAYGPAVSLDAVSACGTAGELAALLEDPRGAGVLSSAG